MQRFWGMLCAMAGAVALVQLSVGAAQAVSGEPPAASARTVQSAPR